MTVHSFGPGSLGCVTPTQEQMALSQIIQLLSAIACKTNSYFEITTGCLQVSVAGTWGEVGDIIQVIRWFDTRQIPPTSFYTLYINTRTNTLVTGISESNTTECSAGGDGSGVFNFEYFICDNGTQKIVQICGTSCGEYNVNYLAFDRSESTEPADWNLVTAGSCSSLYGVYAEDSAHVSGDRGIAVLNNVVSDVAPRASVGDYAFPGIDINGRTVTLPFAPTGATFQFRLSILNNSLTVFTAAPGVGLSYYITDISVVNNTATAAYLDILSDSTIIWTQAGPANSGTSHSFGIPIRGYENKGIDVQVTSGGAISVLFSATFYVVQS